MKSWHILFSRFEGGPKRLIVLPSFWKVLWWFICTGRRCSDIRIFTVREV